MKWGWGVWVGVSSSHPHPQAEALPSISKGGEIQFWLGDKTWLCHSLALGIYLFLKGAIILLWERCTNAPGQAASPACKPDILLKLREIESKRKVTAHDRNGSPPEV